jgi:hypothetical protein
LNELSSSQGGETWFPYGGTHGASAEVASIQEAIDHALKLDPYKGGNGLLVRPKRGDGIIFLNHLSDGTLDPYAVHAGLTVADGDEKWIANYWID